MARHRNSVTVWLQDETRTAQADHSCLVVWRPQLVAAAAKLELMYAYIPDPGY
jgi:hypothetical protein